MANIIYLSNVRLSFPSLVEARASVDTPGAVKKFSADLLMAPSHANLAQFMAEVNAVATAKWAEHAANVLQIIQSDRKLRCYGNGAEKIDKKTFKPYVGYEGNIYISANREEMPQMIMPDGSAVDSANTMAYQAMARKLYGGCYVNAAVRPWTQDNKHGRGIRCDLVAIQFYADGDAFGEGVVDAAPMFGAVAAPSLSAMSVPAAGAPVFPGFLGG